MILHISLVVVSLCLLFCGAEGLVRGSSSLAIRAGLSPLLVGLTIVAFGTSSPELVVSIKATLMGQGDIAIGNVVGSNSFNIGVILAITALVCPIPVHRQVIRIDAPIAFGLALLLPVLLWDGTLERTTGGLLFIGILAYTWMNIILSKREAVRPGEGDVEAVPGVTRSWVFDAVMILGGVAVLILGSRLLVDNSIALAKAFGVSEAVIGLTIVAAGTSMPELATSLVAAWRRQPDIAVGNIVGSNIFNILAILGISAMVSPIQATGITALDFGFMILFSLLLLPMLYTGRTLHRVEGGVLLALYGVYLFFLWPQ
jgi:cation:H+ antiporter